MMCKLPSKQFGRVDEVCIRDGLRGIGIEVDRQDNHQAFQRYPNGCCLSIHVLTMREKESGPVAEGLGGSLTMNHTKSRVRPLS